ncbi:hypothetical protein LSTR_LSTR007826 [Laodelphax striatellus]|uniref:Uncharacterized protein n=1 Tax=Laodelphax striatellus TaxID=195883 RepID=A0A482WMN9_LAOST|nr:hypothetical protein LSTR_LSTR007826 [Laodelphax striatellus]
MIQGEKQTEDYQNRVVDSENLKQGQEKLKSETCDSNSHVKPTEPLSFLEDLDKDIDRKFSIKSSLSAIQNVNSDHQLQASNSKEISENNSDRKEGKISSVTNDLTKSNDSCRRLSSPQTSGAKPSMQSNSSLRPRLKQTSNSKIPQPVRSQRSNMGIQQPASKMSHSCRTVPVADRHTNPTQFRRQRQSSVGPGGSSAQLKHPLPSTKDGKRNENDTESSHRNRIKPSQSSPIRKYDDMDVILAAKKAGGETGQKSANEDSEPVLEVLDNVEHKTPESRNEFFIWLSNAISEKRLNPSKLDEYFSNYKSSFAYSTDSQTIEEIEALQKLIKKVSDLYEQYEAEKIANTKLQANFQLAHNNDSRKICLLEAENQNLINNMDNLGKRLDEEVANNDRMKKGSQTIPLLKKKIKDVEQRLKSWEDKQKEQIQKLKSLETNCKQKSIDHIEKELKEITSICEKLSQENDILKRELQKSEDEQNLKLVKMIDDSEEMRQMREELSVLRSRFNEELNRGKRYFAEQQQTSSKLRETEMKCRNLSQLIEEAKKEIKAKNQEYEEFKKTVEEDKQMMKTELDACKVIKQGTIDENTMLRAKIESMQSKHEKVHSLEKESIEIEQQLRTDLALRDEQIMQLQEQIKSLLPERKNGKDVTKLKNKLSLDQCQAGSQERANLAAQILDLQKNVDELANHNLELQKLLADRNAELEQRDHIVRLQTDVLKIRDELIELLRSKDSSHEKHVEELSSILMEREHAIEKEWKKRVESLQGVHSDASKDQTKNFEALNISNAIDSSNRIGSEEGRLSLKDLHLMFQNKELPLDSMQVRIKTLEKNHQNLSHQRIRQETRMRTLEESLQEKSSHTWIPVLVK